MPLTFTAYFIFGRAQLSAQSKKGCKKAKLDLFMNFNPYGLTILLPQYIITIIYNANYEMRVEYACKSKGYKRDDN